MSARRAPARSYTRERADGPTKTRYCARLTALPALWRGYKGGWWLAVRWLALLTRKQPTYSALHSRPPELIDLTRFAAFNRL